MKTVTPALAELLSSGRQFACADLFTIIRQNGDTLRYSSGDVSIRWQENLFSCYGLQVSGLRYRVVTGLEADEQTLTVAGERTMRIEGMPFVEAIQAGALDGARIKRERAYLEAWGDVSPNIRNPVGCITMFSGFVSTVEGVRRASAELCVKSDLALLDVNMPSNTWQASCIHTLFDGGCKALPSSWSVSGTAESGSTREVINWTGATAPTYWGGTILFSSGANAGQTRSIKNSNGTQLILSYELPHQVAEGDAFMASAGCDHTRLTCTNRFDNLSNFRGYPYIPTSETAL